MAKAKRKPALVITVPPDTVTQAIIAQVAFDMGIEAGRITVLRTTRKKGGGFEAEVAVSKPSDDE